MANKAQTLDIQGVLSRMVLAPKLKSDSVSKLNKGLGKLDASEFFGFEKVDSQITELKTNAEREQVTVAMAKLGFPELDYTFLSWRKKDSKLPAFMVLDLDTNEFSVTVESNFGTYDDDLDDITWDIEPLLSAAITAQFEQAIIYLGELSADKYDSDEIVITAQFQGVMPADVRQKTMSVLKRCVFDDIFIICEAPTWKINKTGRTDKKDPLVVGWIEKTSQMFLIASFDITSLEDYVLTQFKK